ncbi:hypothetical protein Pan161_07740 [Gimesia algae]|uniref:Uncharacterized protein n=1 Tax=Gimesia algae TaxID=2527971 RepID=A0A517V815_9PLAN|nr:hypothetical protein Pan161_07740 [Gimesia algae]
MQRTTEPDSALLVSGAQNLTACNDMHLQAAVQQEPDPG